jgi:hypothetical protein
VTANVINGLLEADSSHLIGREWFCLIFVGVCLIYVIYEVSDWLIEWEFSSLIGSTFLPHLRGGLPYLRNI